jgi:hypothetical protein
MHCSILKKKTPTSDKITLSFRSNSMKAMLLLKTEAQKNSSSNHLPWIGQMDVACGALPSLKADLGGLGISHLSWQQLSY